MALAVRDAGDARLRPALPATTAARARPVALAGDQLLPVLPALADLFPGGGLRRGSSVAVDGAGSTSLALAAGAAASAAGSWAAAVGVPDLGLAAAGELGVALERLLLVDRPPATQWATVVAALVDAVDLVYVAVPGRVRLGDARRLVARARERGSVLVLLDGDPRVGAAWPVPADVRLTVAGAAWTGPVGGGAGRLEARRVEVVGGGRGAAARARRTDLWLPGPDGSVSAAEPSAFRHQLVDPGRHELVPDAEGAAAS